MNDDDPVYGECGDCGEVGYEVLPCSNCGIPLCSFCPHDDCSERGA